MLLQTLIQRFAWALRGEASSLPWTATTYSEIFHCKIGSNLPVSIRSQFRGGLAPPSVSVRGPRIATAHAFWRRQTTKADPVRCQSAKHHRHIGPIKFHPCGLTSPSLIRQKAHGVPSGYSPYGLKSAGMRSKAVASTKDGPYPVMLPDAVNTSVLD